MEKTITQEQITLLSKIYNSLTLISTKGDETIIMADCLMALKSVINELSVTYHSQTINLTDLQDIKE